MAAQTYMMDVWMDSQVMHQTMAGLSAQWIRCSVCIYLAMGSMDKCIYCR